MRNRIYLFIAIFVILGFGVFLLTISPKQEVKNYPPQNNTIIAFGDSLVEGVGATSDTNFVSLLSKKVGLPIKNFGKSGDTTESALERVPVAIAEKPGVVLILLGGNDALRRVPREVMRENLRLIIESFQDVGAVVLLLGVRGGIIKDNYENEFETLSRELGTVYVPNVLDELIGNSEYMYDTIHPNEKGYEIIAERIEPVLTQLLNQ